MSTPGDSPLRARAAAMGQLRVELDRLQETSDELGLEVDQLGDAAERLRGDPNFGDSRLHSTVPLWQRHQEEILPGMQQLVRDIDGGLRAGQRVLRQIAKRYEEADAKGKRRIDDELERVLAAGKKAAETSATDPKPVQPPTDPSETR